MMILSSLICFLEALLIFLPVSWMQQKRGILQQVWKARKGSFSLKCCPDINLESHKKLIKNLKSEISSSPGKMKRGQCMTIPCPTQHCRQEWPHTLGLPPAMTASLCPKYVAPARGSMLIIQKLRDSKSNYRGGFSVTRLPLTSLLRNFRLH